MNDSTRDALTSALDVAITGAAEKCLKEITKGMSSDEIARSIHRSLDSFRELAGGKMPAYNEWDALFYSLWYQPGHINLAYSLAREIPEDENPLLTGSGRLHVVDFGCGQFAVKFGLALAAAETLQSRPKIRGARSRNIAHMSFDSYDSSEPMMRMGRMIWRRFVNETARYSDLAALHRMCLNLDKGFQNDTRDVCWVTAFHVAYEENIDEVENHLGNIVENEEPDLVLVTTHRLNESHAFSPEGYGYSDNSHYISGTIFDLCARFEQATQLRANLYETEIHGKNHSLTTEEEDFIRSYLTTYPTAWTTPRFETTDFLYLKD